MEPTTLSCLHHHYHNNLLSTPLHHRYLHHTSVRLPRRQVIRAFQRGDFDSFARRVSSGEAWKEEWQSANDSFEYFTYEARKTTERIDREYKVSVMVNSAVSVLQDKAWKFEIGQKWRGSMLDFARSWPRYRREISEVVGSPLGRSAVVLDIGIWVLPFAGPLLIGSLAKSRESACKRQFVGSRLQVLLGAGFGNIVWQPTSEPFPRNSGGGSSSSSTKPRHDVIDVEFEER